MDRFIGPTGKPAKEISSDLKSNMDRFIVHTRTYKKSKTKHLKSNMDRFIDKTRRKIINPLIAFKIQYG